MTSRVFRARRTVKELLTMIYVTGDTHGDLSRFRGKEARRLKRNDTLLILGDFGFVWQGTPAERRTLKKLAKKRYRILFLDGSHENYDLLAEYPEVELDGGHAWQLGPRLFRLRRGEVYTVEGRTLLCLGGGESLDRESREEGVTWWPAELPDAADYARCDAALAAHGNTVDYILTHDGPARLLHFLRLNRDTVLYEENALELYLNELMQRAKYQRWLFGRYHLDQPIGSSACAVYKKLLPLE